MYKQLYFALNFWNFESFWLLQATSVAHVAQPWKFSTKIEDFFGLSKNVWGGENSQKCNRNYYFFVKKTKVKKYKDLCSQISCLYKIFQIEKIKWEPDEGSAPDFAFNSY